MVAAGAVLLRAQVVDGGSSLVAAPSAGPSAAPAVPAAPPPFIAPQTAVPGDWITVLGFRSNRLCGPAELRFDGVAVVHRLTAYVASADSDHRELLLTAQVPRAAKRGSHLLELYGPVPGGRTSPICAMVHEHQAALATTTITVVSHRGDPVPARRPRNRSSSDQG